MSDSRKSYNPNYQCQTCGARRMELLCEQEDNEAWWCKECGTVVRVAWQKSVKLFWQTPARQEVMRDAR